jgi:hypothetical protein
VTVAAVVGVLALLGPTSGAAPPGSQVLYRASTSASAVHGFYDHQGLFPVPLLNLSVPYTEATLEPGPTTSSLGSFVWEPEAAELKTILCVLSNNQFCQFPEYPFQDRASYPSAGGEENPPTIEVDQPQAPVQARAAHEEAEASAQGAEATAAVAGLEAVPMSPAQAKAAQGLAAGLSALQPFATPEKADPWLVAFGQGVSGSETSNAAHGASAFSETDLTNISLVGGLITVRAAHGFASAAVGANAGATAQAGLAGLTVGDFEAGIGPHGIRVVDQDLGKAQAAAVNAALNEALARIGMEISRGAEDTERSKDSSSAEAYAFSLDFERETLPGQAPEGTAGPDVLHVPVGLAAADAEVAQIVSTGPPPAAPKGAIGGGAPPVGGLGAPAPPAPRAAPVPSSEVKAPRRVEARPAAGFSNMGIPAVAVAVAVLLTLIAAAALTWLKVNEVLTE